MVDRALEGTQGSIERKELTEAVRELGNNGPESLVRICKLPKVQERRFGGRVVTHASLTNEFLPRPPNDTVVLLWTRIRNGDVGATALSHELWERIRKYVTALMEADFDALRTRRTPLRLGRGCGRLARGRPCVT